MLTPRKGWANPGPKIAYRCYRPYEKKKNWGTAGCLERPAADCAVNHTHTSTHIHTRLLYNNDGQDKNSAFTRAAQGELAVSGAALDGHWRFTTRPALQEPAGRGLGREAVGGGVKGQGTTTLRVLRGMD